MPQTPDDSLSRIQTRSSSSTSAPTPGHAGAAAAGMFPTAKLDAPEFLPLTALYVGRFPSTNHGMLFLWVSGVGKRSTGEKKFVFVAVQDEAKPQPAKSLKHVAMRGCPFFAPAKEADEQKSFRGVCTFEIKFSDIVGIDYHNPLLVEMSRMVMEAQQVTRRWFPTLDRCQEHYGWQRTARPRGAELLSDGGAMSPKSERNAGVTRLLSDLYQPWSGDDHSPPALPQVVVNSEFMQHAQSPSKGAQAYWREKSEERTYERINNFCISVVDRAYQKIPWPSVKPWGHSVPPQPQSVPPRTESVPAQTQNVPPRTQIPRRVRRARARLAQSDPPPSIVPPLDSELSAIDEQDPLVEVMSFQTVHFRFDDPFLPYVLREVVHDADHPNLLRLYEAGLPAWCVHAPMYVGGLYRRWMRLGAAGIILMISCVSMLLGFYDVYTRAPALRALLASSLEPVNRYFELFLSSWGVSAMLAWIAPYSSMFRRVLSLGKSICEVIQRLATGAIWSVAVCASWFWAEFGPWISTVWQPLATLGCVGRQAVRAVLRYGDGFFTRCRNAWWLFKRLAGSLFGGGGAWLFKLCRNAFKVFAWLLKVCHSIFKVCRSILWLITSLTGSLFGGGRGAKMARETTAALLRSEFDGIRKAILAIYNGVVFLACKYAKHQASLCLIIAHYRQRLWQWLRTKCPRTRTILFVAGVVVAFVVLWLGFSIYTAWQEAAPSNTPQVGPAKIQTSRLPPQPRLSSWCADDIPLLRHSAAGKFSAQVCTKLRANSLTAGALHAAGFFHRRATAAADFFGYSSSGSGKETVVREVRLVCGLGSAAPAEPREGGAHPLAGNDVCWSQQEGGRRCQCPIRSLQGINVTFSAPVPADNTWAFAAWLGWNSERRRVSFNANVAAPVALEIMHQHSPNGASTESTMGCYPAKPGERNAEGQIAQSCMVSAQALTPLINGGAAEIWAIDKHSVDDGQRKGGSALAGFVLEAPRGPRADPPADVELCVAAAARSSVITVADDTLAHGHCAAEGRCLPHCDHMSSERAAEAHTSPAASSGSKMMVSWAYAGRRLGDCSFLRWEAYLNLGDASRLVCSSDSFEATSCVGWPPSFATDNEEAGQSAIFASVALRCADPDDDPPLVPELLERHAARSDRSTGWTVLEAAAARFPFSCADLLPSLSADFGHKDASATAVGSSGGGEVAKVSVQPQPEGDEQSRHDWKDVLDLDWRLWPVLVLCPVFVGVGLVRRARRAWRGRPPRDQDAVTREDPKR